MAKKKAKKAKFKTRYVEPVYPAEFRFRYIEVDNELIHTRIMITGWVQNAVHVQWGFQSLQ